MSESESPFESWVSSALTSWGLDGGVLGPYVASLAEDPDPDPDRDRRQQLVDLLSDMTDNDVDKKVDEIMEKWNFFNPIKSEEASNSVNVEDRLVKLLGSQTLVTSVPKQYTDEEKKIRDAILKQYSQLSEDEETGNGSEGEGSSDLVRNMNAATVAAAAKEKRELAKQESQRKKEKDKEDREKQKQLREEKKEKRKTQKGERKR